MSWGQVSANAGPIERCDRYMGKFHGLITPITHKPT